MSSQFTTRPALRTRMGQQADSPPRLRLTVVFHPQLDRIGAFVDLAPWPDSVGGALVRPVPVGRNQPILSDGQALNEPHVSRTAFELSRTGVGANSTLRITAGPTSLCRLGAQEASQLVVDAEQLKGGVPIRLGHGVVLSLRLVEPLPMAARVAADQLLGASAEMARLRLHLAAISATDLPVLILGESGVGKEVVAQSIHEASARRNGPLVTVNTAAFNESLAGAELFGNTRSAFTGAAARKGYFEDADGGTLFLDEIADAADVVQVQLLRALEQGEIQVLGGGIKRVNVRVIAATDGAIDGDSGFRHALLTRLSGHTVSIPPLRHRREDIGPQAVGFLRRAALSTVPFAIEACATEPEVAAHWAKFFFNGLSHDWPGNSRELRNTVIRVANGDPEVAPPLERVATPEAAEAVAVSVTDDELEQVYQAHDFEIAATSLALGIPRPSLYRRIRKHPKMWLIDDLSDDQVKMQIAEGGSLKDVARRLRVSEYSLRNRLRGMQVG